MAYGNMTETVKALFNTETDLPWNAEAKKRKSEGDEPFANLNEVMSEAVDPEKRAQMQKSVLTNLVGWRGKNGKDGGGPLELDGDQAEKVQEYLDDNPTLDEETRDELVKIKEVYADAKRQAQLMKTFTDRLLKELKLDGIKEAKDLSNAVDETVKDPATVQKAITKIRDEMSNENVKFDRANPMLRDLMLILESLGGGGFSDLCEKMTK